MDNTIATMKNILMGCAVAVTLSASLALASCSEELELAGDPNALRIEVEDEWAAQADTRVAYSNNAIHAEFEEGDAIGVYAFDGSSYTASNVKFTKQADGSWLGETKVLYNPNLTYYAYYPYDANNSYTPNADGTVNDVDTKFADFITDASGVFWKSDQSTKANFDQSNLMISKGELTDVVPVVKFTMNHKRGLAILSGSLGYWHYSTSSGDKNGMTLVSVTGNTPYAESSGNYCFLTMPSVITSVLGKKVKLKAGEYAVVNIGSITGTVSIQYSESTDGGSTWSAWSDTAPSWLTVANAAQDDEPVDFNVTTTIDIDTWGPKMVDGELQANPTANNVDLSMVDNAGKARSSRTTANCYLVHAPGTYRIPLVYGNAIKNGATNTSSYHTDVVNDNVRQTLVNHADQEITSPWIEDNLDSDGNTKISVDGAKLIWEDMKDMIKDLRIVSDTEGKKYLTFTVDADHIAEGNAVVSATSNGTVVWSWHIWVTNQTLSTTTAVNTGSNTYNVADVNLGAVAANFENDNRCRIKVAIGDVTLQFEVEQKCCFNNAQRSLINTYYQWGRYVAEPPATTSNLYDADGSLFTFSLSHSGPSIGTTIQNPGTHYYYDIYDIGPYSEDKYNYWDMNQTGTNNISTPTVKTVYDPCPPDFCVPTSNLYYYMGDNSSSTEWVGDNDSGPGGIWTKDSQNIFFPASGSRDYFYSFLFDVGSGGYCWSASANNYRRGLNIGFYSGGGGWNNNVRSNGFPVRPVLEE